MYCGVDVGQRTNATRRLPSGGGARGAGSRVTPQCKILPTSFLSPYFLIQVTDSDTYGPKVTFLARTLFVAGLKSLQPAANEH